MNAPAAASEPFLYRDLAERLAHSVATGAFRIGDRLPSVRELAAQERVSIATAVAAYRDLEARRIIEARPKSGFFVAPRRNQLPEPASSARRQRRCSLDGVSRLTLEILEAAGNPDVVPLGAACPSPELMFSATEVRRVTAARLRSDPGLATEYRMGPGFAPLRRAIAQQAFAFGCTLDPDEIVVTNGCMEALTLGLRAITKPGDTVAMESPTYFGLLQIAESLGLKVLEIPTSPRHGMSVEALDLATRRPGAIAAVVVTPTISNPLGSVMPDAAKRRLVALMAERDIPVIEDDVYGDLHFGERRPRVLRSWDATGNVLLCSSFTKTVAPGLRVGWIAPGRWRDAVALLKFTTSIATSELNQAVITDLIASGGLDRHLRRMRAVFRLQVQRMTDAIERHFPEGTRITRPAGGFVLWVELPPSIDTLALFWKALERGVSIAPGTMFSASGGCTHHLRLSCGMPFSDTIERAIRTLGELAATD